MYKIQKNKMENTNTESTTTSLRTTTPLAFKGQKAQKYFKVKIQEYTSTEIKNRKNKIQKYLSTRL